MTEHNITRMIVGALLAASGALSIAADNRLGGAPAFEGVDWQLVQFRTGDTMQDTVASEHSAVLRFDGWSPVWQRRLQPPDGRLSRRRQQAAASSPTSPRP